MFVQHKQLKFLSAPASKVAKLHSAPSAIQLAFAGCAPQPCRAYLMQLVGGGKALVVVAFYLLEQHESIFFVPPQGEVFAAEAASLYEEGYQFVESMGFVLMESDFHLLSRQDKQTYWARLPFTQPATAAGGVRDMTAVADPEEELSRLRQKSLASLGRYLATL